jgi:hypothetical protein
MASRSHGWFDEAKLLPSERLIRRGTARLRMPAPPYWWEGALTLTSDRLFFLPFVDHPRLDDAAFWLHDLTGASRSGRNRFAVACGAQGATFQLVGSRRGPAGLIGDQAAPWLQAIASLRPVARPHTAFENLPRRRAAG